MYEINCMLDASDGFFHSPIYQKGNKYWYYVCTKGHKSKSEMFYEDEVKGYHATCPPATKEMIESWPEINPVPLAFRKNKAKKTKTKVKPAIKKKAGKKKK
ncbi:MAG: hypothetical protein JST75_09275 [Bacteroidetes bacterium]|nr:hypothetical protein [Bacteroidota bacterium]